MLRTLLTTLLISSTLWLSGQTGCPGCQITLPDLPQDTIYLSAAPDGEAGQFYNGDMSFRLPRTTTPVNATDPNTPAGLPIDAFTILAVTGLPTGMRWEASQLEFVTSQQTDGCVKLCGTPYVPGLYTINVVIQARILFVTQQTAFSFPLLIAPAQTVAEGFTIVNSSGCGQVEATFINNVPSNGADGFSYMWFFSNGNATTAEQPDTQRYSQPGEYTVSYQAIVDTVGYILTRATVVQSPCTDLFTRPDMKIDFYHPDGSHLFTTNIIDNTDAPITFDLFIPLGEGDYELRVVDDDGGLDGADDLCGSIFFNRTTPGLLSDSTGELLVAIEIIHPVDTIRSAGTVTVYPNPAPPVLGIQEDPPYCAGQQLHLASTNYTQGLVWYQDGTVVEGQTGGTLEVNQAGDYWATFTSEVGCQSVSPVVRVDFPPIFAPFMLRQTGNLITIVNESNLPEEFSFTWLYEGEVVAEATELRICADATGSYTLVVVDEATGCANSVTLAVTYDPGINCSTPTSELDGAAANWRVFPNPMQDVLFVQGDGAAAGSLQVFNAVGQRLVWQSIQAGYARVDVAQWPAGVYYYRLLTTDHHILQTGSLVKP